MSLDSESTRTRARTEFEWGRTKEITENKFRPSIKLDTSTLYLATPRGNVYPQHSKSV